MGWREVEVCSLEWFQRGEWLSPSHRSDHTRRKIDAEQTKNQITEDRDAVSMYHHNRKGKPSVEKRIADAGQKFASGASSLKKSQDRNRPPHTSPARLLRALLDWNRRAREWLAFLSNRARAGHSVCHHLQSFRPCCSRLLR